LQVTAAWLAIALAAYAQPSADASVARADASVARAGVVKRTAGQVSLDRSGTRLTPMQGTEIRVGDTLRTGADGALGITLADDTLLTVGANSELLINAFNFDSTTHDGNMLATLWKGTLGLVTGLIGRKAPEKVRVQTRTVVLGVRGTEFIVDAGRGAP